MGDSFRSGSLGLFLVVATTFALQSRSTGHAESPAPKSESQASSNDQAVQNSEIFFSHQAHAEKLDVNKCQQCHTGDLSAPKPPPTNRGHQPCLSSGCHVQQFLSTGPRTKKQAPKKYQEATQFCSVCHKSNGGGPPPRFAKAKADALFESKKEAEFHVEMNHAAHSKRTNCTTCHQIDTQNFKLKDSGPDHSICSTCHEDSEQPMSNCQACHQSPGPQAYFTRTRKKSDVRECKEQKDSKAPCFRHERKEHRFHSDGSPLECVSCHYMFKKAKHGKFPYKSLADVRAAPIMDNSKDMAHKSCGASGCHRSEVDDSRGTGKCSLCHSQRFMASGLFD